MKSLTTFLILFLMVGCDSKFNILAQQTYPETTTTTNQEVSKISSSVPSTTKVPVQVSRTIYSPERLPVEGSTPIYQSSGSYQEPTTTQSYSTVEYQEPMRTQSYETTEYQEPTTTTQSYSNVTYQEPTTQSHTSQSSHKKSTHYSQPTSSTVSVEESAYIDSSKGYSSEPSVVTHSEKTKLMSVSSAIPKKCQVWTDGCNTCTRKNSRKASCTTYKCESNIKFSCLEWN